MINRGPVTYVKEHNMSIDAKRNIKQYILPIVDNCNLACEYCFAKDNSNFKFKSYTNNDIINVLKFIVDSNNTNTRIDICFFGGEPLLKPEIIEFTIDTVKNKYPKHKFSFSITTNGTIFNNRIINLIKKENINILLSLDGDEEDSSLRRYANGFPSFSKVINNIEKIRGIIPINIRCTIASNNFDLVKTVSFLEELKLPYLYSFVYKSGNKDHNYGLYSDDVIENLKRSLDELNDFFLEKIKNNNKIYCQTIINNINTLRKRDRNNIACEGGVSMLSITSNGDIFSCQHLVNYPKFKIGNIESGIDQILFSESKPTDVKNIKVCNKCWIRFLCSGGCFSEKLLCNKSVHDSLPEDSCNLEKLKWEYTIRLYSKITKKFPEYFKKFDNEKMVNN
jgi:radical SAM protein with 4Fe4S-binding SPASM domain